MVRQAACRHAAGDACVAPIRRALRGVDLLGLPVGTRLRLGACAIVEVTRLRNPCAQLDGLQPGLMAATLDRDAEGNLARKAGIMDVVLTGGEVRAGDAIRVELPSEPYDALKPV